MPLDDMVTFEMGPGTAGSSGVLEARVREAAKQIAAAANRPQPSIRL